MTFDVAGRLAEGLAALDNTQLYVQACALRGFSHPDLTLHSGQLRDWYRTEEGLDLLVLDADCAVLHAAARSAADALQLSQSADVSTAWSGHGGGAAVEFVSRHVGNGGRVADSVDAAARAAERLRDDLWRIVDGKVQATIAADDRVAAQRPAWLAAARAMLGGGSEDAAAVVDSEITPHVVAVIAGEWLTAMRESVSAVGAAYRVALDSLAANPFVLFEIPGDLVSRPAAPVVSAAASVPPVVAVPAAAAAAPTVPAAAVSGSIPETAPWPPNPGVAPSQPTEPMPAPPPAPMSPTSLPDPTAGLGGLPGGFADALGGLLGAGPDLGSSAGMPEPEPIEAPDVPEAAEETDDPEEGSVEEDEDEGPDEEAAATVPDDSAAEEDPAVPEEPPATEEPETEVPATPVPEPVPLAEPSPVAEQAPATPCEIAADELPQVGE